MIKIFKSNTVLLIIVIIVTSFKSSEFISDQKKSERVKKAYNEKSDLLKKELLNKGISFDQINVLFVAYKSEQLIDVYAKNKSDIRYEKIHSYNVCAKSGKLGPKRRSGDYQVPEGFYHIERFNPSSRFYLSLGVSYPNQSDRIKSKASNLGGDIFIHGNCLTIGCMPMTDDKIKEIYIYALQAKESGQVKIPVYIFPFNMNNINYKAYCESYKQQADLIPFWSNLKIGYDKFFKEQVELNFKINDLGDYEF